jgi:hypothetical protein
MKKFKKKKNGNYYIWFKFLIDIFHEKSLKNPKYLIKFINIINKSLYLII